MNATPVHITLHTPGPGLNAYTLKDQIEARGFVQLKFADDSVRMLEVKSVRLMDTNELNLEGWFRS